MVTSPLTFVTDNDKSQDISLIEGRIPDAIRNVGASAVLPRGLATRAGAALGIIPFGTTAEA